MTLDVGQGSLTDGEANAVLDAADPAKKAGLQTAVGGYVGQELSKADSGNSDKIGILAAVIILLLVFGSAVAMGLPIITAVLGLLCGLSVITLLSHVTDVPTTAPTVATMIGLAVGIDYSLFVVTKHRAQVAQGMEVQGVDRPRDRHSGRSGPVRRRDRRDLAPGARRRGNPARDDARLHGGDRGGLRDPGRAHPAAGPVRPARRPHQLAPAPVR